MTGICPSEALNERSSDSLERLRVTAEINLLIQRIDEVISRTVLQIISHDTFVNLESSWRGLAWMVSESVGLRNVKIKIFNADIVALEKDLRGALEFDQSVLFKNVYSEEFGTPGGEPYSVLVGDYYFGGKMSRAGSAARLDLLREIAQVSAASFVPFVSSISPDFFGIGNFSQLTSRIAAARLLQSTDSITWQAIRSDQNTRFIGLCLPKVRARTTYKYNLAKQNKFIFGDLFEDYKNNQVKINAAFAFALIAARNFDQYGWFLTMCGASNLSTNAITPKGSLRCSRGWRQAEDNGVTEIYVSDQREKELADIGLISFCKARHEDFALFYSVPSIYDLKKTSLASDSKYDDYDNISQLNYTLCISRIAHYIKVIFRDKVGSFLTPEECKNYLESWMVKYIVDGSNVSAAMKTKYPLNSAKITMSESMSKPGEYICAVYLKLHPQIGSTNIGMKLVFNVQGGRYK